MNIETLERFGRFNRVFIGSLTVEQIAYAGDGNLSPLLEGVKSGEISPCMALGTAYLMGENQGHSDGRAAEHKKIEDKNMNDQTIREEFKKYLKLFLELDATAVCNEINMKMETLQGDVWNIGFKRQEVK